MCLFLQKFTKRVIIKWRYLNNIYKNLVKYLYLHYLNSSHKNYFTTATVNLTIIGNQFIQMTCIMYIYSFFISMLVRKI